MGSLRSADLFEVAARLCSEGVGFALMTIVRAVSPTSGKPGDKAILTERGEWLGWVGGSCAEPAARRAAQAALADGQSRLIHLTNDETDIARSGVELSAMSCYSGGSLEIYVEPHLAQPWLVVFGRSPIATALCELGAVLKYRVTHVDLRPAVPHEVRASFDAAGAPGSERGSRAALPEGIGHATRLSELSEPGRNTWVVVASHGHHEEDALEWALGRDVAYVGLVSSQRRLPDVHLKLEQRGLGSRLDRLHAPAGLRLGAAGPEEVALSVLSEIVAERRGVARQAAVTADPATASSTGRGSVASWRAEPASAAEARAARAEPSCCDVPEVRSARVEPSCCDVPEVRSARAAPSCCGVPEAVPEVRAARVEPSSSDAPATRREPTFSAVVLAAGLSRRMGAPNKLLLRVAGRPMIVHGLEAVLAAGFAQVVVVLGHQAEEVGAAIHPLGVPTVFNAHYETGQVSSVRAGLAALRDPTDAVMVCLGDQPLLTSADLRATMAAFARRNHGSVLVPMFGEQRGNPVVLDWASARQTLEQGTNFGCRHFMAENPERVVTWQTGSDHFIRDVDQPGDYEALLTQAEA